MKYKVIDKDTGMVLYVADDYTEALMFMNYNDSVFQKCFNYELKECETI